MIESNATYNNLPGPLTILFLLGFCIVVALLKLGDNWFEVIIRIGAFLFSLTLAFTLYEYVTDIVWYGNLKFKGFYHLLLLLVFPLIIYIGIKIYS